MDASFSRDRLTEAYFWIIGVYYEPQFSFARKVYRKIFKSTSLLDDTYDAYGTIEELELLTEMFQRFVNKYSLPSADFVLFKFFCIIYGLLLICILFLIYKLQLMVKYDIV